MNKREKAKKILEEKEIHYFLNRRLLIATTLSDDAAKRMPKTFSLIKDDRLSFKYKGNKYLFKMMNLDGDIWNTIYPGDWCFYFNDELVLKTEVDSVKGEGIVVSDDYEVIKLSDWVEDLPIIMSKIMDVEEQLYQESIAEKDNKNIDLGKYDDE